MAKRRISKDEQFLVSLRRAISLAISSVRKVDRLQIQIDSLRAQVKGALKQRTESGKERWLEEHPQEGGDTVPPPFKGEGQQPLSRELTEDGIPMAELRGVQDAGGAAVTSPAAPKYLDDLGCDDVVDCPGAMGSV